MSNVAQLIREAENYLQRREIGAADERLTQALTLQSDNTLALMHLCLMRLAKQQTSQAESLLQRFLASDSRLNSDKAAQHFISTLLHFNRFNGAVLVADRTSEWFPNSSALRWLRIQSALQSRAIDKALALTTEWVDSCDDVHKPQVMLTHANTLAKQGSFAEAIHFYEAVIAHQPHNSFAIAGLMKSQRITHPSVRYEAMFEQAFRAQLDEEHRERIGFAHAKYLNDLGQYTSAWHSAEQANNSKRKRLRFDRNLLQKQVDAILNAYSRVVNRASNDTDNEADLTPHVLIVGMPRSGTTLVEQMLAPLPDYYAGGETPALEICSTQGPHGEYFLEPLAKGEPIGLGAMAESYTRYFKQFSNYSGHIIVDKVPTNFFHIGLFKQLFPNGKVINLQRHPFDVATSIFFESFSARFAYTHSVDDILFVHQQYQRLMAAWSEWYGGDILTLDYQQLVTNYANTVANVERFLNVELPSEEAIRAAENPVETPSIWQVRQPINNHAIDRWKRYPEAFEPFQLYP